MIRRAVYLASVLLLGAAIVLVPLPVLVIEPGPAASVTGQGQGPSFIEVGGETDPLDGSYLLTAVRVSSDSTAGVVQAIASPVEEVRFARAVVPPGVDPEQFSEFQRQLFRESIQTAGAVGARAAGRDVTITGEGAEVRAVIPGSPAEGELQEGDVIVGVDGQQIELATQLQTVLEGMDPGDEVTLEIRRGDETVERTIGLQPLEGLRAGLGVFVTTVNREIDLPVEVEPGEASNIGGPSAGLMFSLAVYDLLSGGSLADGRQIAGTGTIDLRGRVGRITGIQAKVAAAERVGADVFLAPEELVEEARSVANDIEVIGVSTIDEAIEALEGGG